MTSKNPLALINPEDAGTFLQQQGSVSLLPGMRIVTSPHVPAGQVFVVSDQLGDFGQQLPVAMAPGWEVCPMEEEGWDCWQTYPGEPGYMNAGELSNWGQRLQQAAEKMGDALSSLADRIMLAGSLAAVTEPAPVQQLPDRSVSLKGEL